RIAGRLARQLPGLEQRHAARDLARPPEMRANRDVHGCAAHENQESAAVEESRSIGGIQSALLWRLGRGCEIPRSGPLNSGMRRPASTALIASLCRAWTSGRRALRPARVAYRGPSEA